MCSWKQRKQQYPKRLGFIFEGIEREGELLSNGFTDLEGTETET